jgi:hypothetical protein
MDAHACPGSGTDGAAAAVPRVPRSVRGAAPEAWTPELLARLFELLPPVTIACVSRPWADWARPRVAELRAEIARRRAAALDAAAAQFEADAAHGLRLPTWMLQQAWPGLTAEQQVRAACRLAYHGDVAVLTWALACRTGGWDEVGDGAGGGPLVCAAAAAGGSAEALECARLQFRLKWDARCCTAAARAGHVGILEVGRLLAPGGLLGGLLMSTGPHTCWSCLRGCMHGGACSAMATSWISCPSPSTHQPQLLPCSGFARAAARGTRRQSAPRLRGWERWRSWPGRAASGTTGGLSCARTPLPGAATWRSCRWARWKSKARLSLARTRCASSGPPLAIAAATLSSAACLPAVSLAVGD